VRSGAGPGQSSVSPVASAFPTAVDVVEVPFVKILDRESRHVVTVIEVLSPTNKLKSDDRAAYIAKRNQIRRSEVHFIEIDLLRAGEPMPLVDQPKADYRVVLSRQEERPKVVVWPVQLRDPLPPIPVPLRSPDPDVSIDLAEVVNRVYDLTGYADYVYDLPVQPPLNDADREWAAELVQSVA